MGTRADFYVGIGPTAEWIGSIAYDGYAIDEMEKRHSKKNSHNQACWAIRSAKTEKDYRVGVAQLLAVREDGTTPDQGWPWPWDDSNTTNYAYAFVNGETHAYRWGRTKPQNEDERGEAVEWPNMKDKKNVTLGARSGLIILSSR